MFRKIFIRMAIIIISFLILIFIAALIYLQQPQFGRSPSKERMERIKKSPNFKNGKFQNLQEFSVMPEGYTMAGEVWRTFFGDNPRKFPEDSIPSMKTDLKSLPIDSNYLVWFGHSSYFLQLGGKRILVDPVLLRSASPLPIGVKAFKGTDKYTAEDFPEIDYVLISHDHFDHLDYRTIKALQPKIKKIICGLGVGETLEYWGFKPEQIVENDWDETAVDEADFRIFTATAQHGSGRFKATDNTLWMSYIIEAGDQLIYVGGDSGYNTHFKTIGEKYGSFDLAILDNGQYGEDWYSSIHMPPKFAIQAAKDLNAKRLFPAHSSKFVLSRHPWDEPLIKINDLSAEMKMKLVMPMIGEAVRLQDSLQVFQKWWVGVN